jgi:hypothetical protein
VTLDKSDEILMKFFDTANADPISDNEFKIIFFFYNISVLVGKIIDDPYLRRIVNSIIDPQTGMVQYFVL